MITAIDSLARNVSTTLPKWAKLERTLSKRQVDILAFLRPSPRTSHAPTEAVNGRLEHLLGTALSFRNLTNHIRKALLNTSGSKH